MKEYHSDEHILVCLSPAPSNAKIIRTAAKMASAFEGIFTALFVETPDFPANEEDKKRLQNNVYLAQQLGASVETVYGDDVSFQIAEYARLTGVTKIVIGSSVVTRRHFFGKPTLTEALIANAPNIDIHIIPDVALKNAYHVKKLKKRSTRKEQASDLIKSAWILFLSTAIGFLFAAFGLSEANIIMVYILGVMITSIVTANRGYSLCMSVISVLIFNFFFTVPKYTFFTYEKEYLATFFVMFLAALLSGALTTKLKNYARQAAHAAYRTKILFETNYILQNAQGSEEIIAAMASQIKKLLGKDVIVYATKDGQIGEGRVFSVEKEETKDYADTSEVDVVKWVYRNNRKAGATTDIFSNAKHLYLAIRVNEHVYGVVGISVAGQSLDAFENSVLLSILGECALALESDKNAREKEQAAILAKNEQLRANLLRTISHDLRTPLTSISGNASNLLSNGQFFDESMRTQIYSDIYEDSMWLINLVENLLSITRIEDGKMSLKLSSELIHEVIGEALQHVTRKSLEHKITVHSSDEFILAKIDAKLIVQVIINIIDNAIKYTPAESEIVISTKRARDFVEIKIADNGPGIDEEVKKHIFEMFYSGTNKIADSRRSLGLGLYLCKAIIDAHGGELSVADNVPCGTIFTFTLPAEEVNLHE